MPPIDEIGHAYVILGMRWMAPGPESLVAPVQLATCSQLYILLYLGHRTALIISCTCSNRAAGVHPIQPRTKDRGVTPCEGHSTSPRPESSLLNKVSAGIPTLLSSKGRSVGFSCYPLCTASRQATFFSRRNRRQRCMDRRVVHACVFGRR